MAAREGTIITDLPEFLRSVGVKAKDDRDIIEEHVRQAFAAGFMLEHNTTWKSASHYPFYLTEQDQHELLAPAFDAWVESRRR